MLKVEMRQKLFAFLIPAWVVLSTSSCMFSQQGEEGPKSRLKDYINLSFNVQNADDRKKLESFLTGEARSRLSAWSEEQFRRAFIESKRHFVKLQFREVKNVSPKEVHIVYELTYMNQGQPIEGKPAVGNINPGGDAKITNKKLSQLILDGNQWFIKEVRTIKELVEYKNEMSLP